jgi:hypothetical protein
MTFAVLALATVIVWRVEIPAATSLGVPDHVALDGASIQSLSQSGSSTFQTVQCSDINHCVGFGAMPPDGNVVHLLYAQLAASGAHHEATWSTAIPAPADVFSGTGIYTSVVASCWSAGDCVAMESPQLLVGSSTNTPHVPVAFFFKGGQPTTAGVLPGFSTVGATDGGTVSSVGCTRSGWCLAAGVLSTSDQDQHPKPFYVVESAGHWSQPVVLPYMESGVDPFAEVFCGPGPTCLDVMQTRSVNQHVDALALTIGPSGWSPHPILDLGDRGVVNAAGCDSTLAHCLAAGATNSDSPQASDYVSRLSGGSWSPQEHLTFSDDYRGSVVFARVNAVGCPPSGDCIAVGTTTCVRATLCPDGENLVNDPNGFGYKRGVPFATGAGGSDINMAEILTGTDSASFIAAGHVDAAATTAACSSEGNCVIGLSQGGSSASPSHGPTAHSAWVVEQSGGEFQRARALASTGQYSRFGPVIVSAMSCPDLSQCAILAAGATNPSGEYQPYAFVGSIHAH